MHEFISAFPEGEFSEFINDLYIWYDVLSTVLDDTEATIEEVEDIAEVFWTMIMIEVAPSPEEGVKESALEKELNIDDPEGLQGYLRHYLSELEKEHLEPNNTEESFTEVADAVMMSQLEFAEI